MSSGALLLAPTRRVDRVDEDWETVATHELTPTRAEKPERDEEVERQFVVLADELARDAAGVSSTRRLMRHPAYIAILGLGDGAIPLLLERLESAGSRPVWLRLLSSITASPPGAGQDTIDAAASAWIYWGKHKGYLRRPRALG